MVEELVEEFKVGRLESAEHNRLLAEQGLVSLDRATERLAIKGEAGVALVIREVSQNTLLTSEQFKLTAQKHGQAASIEQKQAISLA